MGANQSAELQQVVDDTERDVAARDTAPAGIRLFKYVVAGENGKWEAVSAHATPNFYDANEDSGQKYHDWFLEIDAGEINVRCDGDLAFEFAVRERRVTFSAVGEIFALRFPTAEGARAFVEALNDHCFYNMHHFERTDTAKAEKELGAEHAYLTSQPSADTMGPMDTDEDFKDAREEDEGSSAPSTPLTEKKAKSLRARHEEEEEEEEVEDGEETYNGLVMGAGANNFMLRGSHFDVLRNEVGGVRDPGISFQLSTPVLKGTPGPVTPGRVLLFNRETKMNLLTPGDSSLMLHADPETGKVVSTWKFQKDQVDIPIADICHDHKAGQLEERNTFVSLDANRLCRWDMRDPRGVVQDSSKALDYADGRDYSRGTNFTCMATAGDGVVAVGSRDGKIRLYPGAKMDRIATTSIPGLGAPITAIDVTFDGKWVLATTDKYLMLVKTTFTDDKGNAANGYTSKMKGRGSAPRLLRLRAEDAVRLKQAPFVKAKFSWVTEGGHSERWIVAGCGSASIIWNFNKVRGGTADSISQGGLPSMTDYIVNTKRERVVDAAFLHANYVRDKDLDTNAALVVATKHDIINIGGV